MEFKRFSRFSLKRAHRYLSALVVATLVFSRPVYADIFKFRAPDGVVTYSESKPLSGPYVKMEPDCMYSYLGCELSEADWRKMPLNHRDYRLQIRQAAERHGVDQALVRAVVHAESAFNPRALSRAGAQGLMQLMPKTQHSLGVRDPFNVWENLDGGTRLLKELLRRYGNDIRLAAAAYNAGPDAVDRYKGIPPYKETRNYVKRVTELYSRYRAAL